MIRLRSIRHLLAASRIQLSLGNQTEIFSLAQTTGSLRSNNKWFGCSRLMSTVIDKPWLESKDSRGGSNKKDSVSRQIEKGQVPDFNDARIAYESKTTRELVRALATFGLCQVPFLVRNAEPLFRLSSSVLGKNLTASMMKATIFGHFCAGENEEEIKPVVSALEKNGVGSILDFAAENDGGTIIHQNIAAVGAATIDRAQEPARVYDYASEARCDQHVEVFKKCIQASKNTSTDGYAAIKVTALVNPKLLQRMSRAITEARKLFSKFDTDKDGLVSREDFESGYRLFFSDAETKLPDLLEQLDPDGIGQVDYDTWSLLLNPKDLPSITKSCREIGPLAMAVPTDEEIELMEAMTNRAHILAEEAVKCNTRLLVDAEQVRFQPAIDNLVLELQQKYNSTELRNSPIIYNTYQCYLKDAAERLREGVDRAEKYSFHFGVKLVRGAYLESEPSWADQLGYPRPIYDTIEETHKCYNDCVEYLLQRNARSDLNLEVMLATHNQQSIEKAIAVMNDLGLERSKSTICFAQLYGMSDNLTFNLGKNGFRAYKYVPYGKVEEVMPYLLRRAAENSSISGQSPREWGMIKDELTRRMKSFI